MGNLLDILHSRHTGSDSDFDFDFDLDSGIDTEASAAYPVDDSSTRYSGVQVQEHVMVEVRSCLVLVLALAPVLVHWSRTHQLVLDYTALYVKSSWW